MQLQHVRNDDHDNDNNRDVGTRLLATFNDRISDVLARDGDVQKAIQAITASARSEDEAKAALKQCGIMEELFGQIKMQDDQPSSDMIDISISKTVASESASQSLRPKRQRSLAAAAAAVKADSADAGSLNPSRRTAAAMMSGKKYLRITISRGLAFLGMNEVSEDASSSLQIHLLYLDKRHSSTPVMSTTDPTFNFQSIIEIPFTDASSILYTQEKAHILVTRTERFSTTSKTLLGIVTLDPREFLTATTTLVPQPRLQSLLDPTAPDITSGLLEITITPLPNTAAFQLPFMADVEAQLKREARELDERGRAFYAYAKAWWADYCGVREGNDGRLVKVFATDEEGSRLPVCCFVSKIHSRYIDSPSHAARFVSLIGVDKSQDQGISKLEIWPSIHTIVTLSKSSLPGHALLLASLLRGFQLDAYVTLGTALVKTRRNAAPTIAKPAAAFAEIATAWVTTVSATTGAVEFWDPVAGTRCSAVGDEAWKRGYRTVGCMFHEDGFWANVGVSEGVRGIASFDVSDNGVWKGVARDVLVSMRRPTSTPFPVLPFSLYHPSIQMTPPFYDPSSNDPSTPPPSALLEDSLEAVLKDQVAAYREDHDMLCIWDDELSGLLSQCLWGCERNKLDGVVSSTSTNNGNIAVGVGAESFQETIRRVIPEGHTFKGFPFQAGGSASLSPLKIFNIMTRAAQCCELMLTRGDTVRFALRVKVYPVVEGVAACWVMVAVRYKPI